MTIIPPVVSPFPTPNRWARPLAPTAPFEWLAEGWHDFKTRPALSLAYGLIIFLISVGFVGGLVALGYDYILFPTFAGFMVVGPILAVGLYEKSRRLESGEPLQWRDLFFVKPRSGGQILFTGVLLSLLMMVWMRAAVIIYALFFGLKPFPGLDHIAPMLFTSATGWAMLAVGTVVGGLFAAFSFAISAFSIPMLLNEDVDALTAMGSSMALVWNNLRVLLIWAATVLVLFLASLATGILVPIAIGMGLAGLAAFMWSLKSGQYDDLEGAAARILLEANEGPALDPQGEHQTFRQERNA
jgi:cbb3-type cytochrome oxidase maturation protein